MMCCAVLSHFSRVQLFVTLWTAARQVSLSMGFSRQEYWSGLPCPPPGDRPNPGIKPMSLMPPALTGGFFTTSATWEAIKVQLLLLLLSRFSRVRLCATPWTAAHQASPSLGFSRQEYWSGPPCPPPGDRPNPGIKPTSLMSPALAGRFFSTSTTWEAQYYTHGHPYFPP